VASSPPVAGIREEIDGGSRQPATSGTSAMLSTVGRMGLVLVLLHLAFRAWASLESWFYLDDYKLLLDARVSSFGPDYLLLPYNSNLMPGGRVLAWLVAEAGPLNWLLASGVILLLQAVAAVGAWWAFLTVFGARWGSLVPLSLYLTSAMALPVMMWWTAGVNQVPLQGAFFLAVGCWVRFLRTPRPLWLVLTVLAVTYGLFFYVKAILILPVLAFLALAYFAQGSPVSRLLTITRRYWPAVVGGLGVGVAYGAYYVTHVTAPFTETSVSIVLRIVDTMVFRAFGSGVVGGPWNWNSQPAPNSFADPPLWAVGVAWLVIGAVVLVGFVTRRRTLRAVALLVGFLVACLALLVNSRGPAFGAIIGLEYRYLTDAACVAALVVGLIYLEIPGAVESSQHRPRPLVRLPAVPNSRWLPLALVAVVAAGGMVSSYRYVHVWHTQNASDSYLRTLTEDLGRLGNVDLTEQEVPNDVYDQIFAPDNRLSRLTPLLDRRVTYPEASEDLAMVDEVGHVHRVDIGPGTMSRPGPIEDCGWRLRDEPGIRVPLRNVAFDFLWWIKISYLSSASTPVTITADDSTVSTSLREGLNDLYVRVEGQFADVRISGLDPGVTLCIDTIEVGPPEPGDPL
jgi:hypothetical protein